MIKLFTSILILACSSYCFSQAEEPIRTFKDTRVINGQSAEVERNGFMKFIISHRFGSFNDDFLYNFFGLDNATVRLGLDYGINDKLTIGAGRTTLDKTFDGFLKYQILQQGESKPLTATILATTAYKALENNNIPEEDDNFTNRTSYSLEFLLAKRFKEKLVVQITPTLVHRNLVQTHDEQHTIFASGATLNYKLSHKVDLNIEYFFIPDGQLTDQNTNPLSIGIDAGTNGHVFQLFMSNSQGMVSPLYLTKTTGTWFDGDIFFGFNISRVFRIKAHKG